ncbi:MAG: SDR family oxidoreductase [Pseudomonadota bacterium]
MKRNKTVLVTGGSGVVGSALIPELIQSGFTVLALVRNRTIPNDRVISLGGDIEAPEFGLDLAAIKAAHGPIDCLIHSAAITNFGHPEESIRAANVVGTENAVAVAEKLGARFIYVSTAYTYDLKLPPYLREYSNYCESKRAAEAHVKANASDWTIVRPSIVVGDTETGYISQFQGLHIIVGAILQRLAPIIPASEQALVDLVPQDVVARGICALAGRNGRHREYWITRGQGAARVSEMHRLMGDFASECGYTSPMPKIVDPEIMERLFIPVFLPSMPPGIRKRLNSLVDHACYFNMSDPFPSNYADLCDEFGLPPMPDNDSVVRNNMQYWAEQTGYRERAA